MENLNNFLDETSVINDLKRLAFMMTMDKSLFIFIAEKIDEYPFITDTTHDSLFENIEEEKGSDQIFDMCARPKRTESTANEISSLLRSAFKKKDTDSLTKVVSILLEYPKEDLAMCLVGSLSKLSPANRLDVLESFVGTSKKWKNKVSIEVVKRNDNQSHNRDFYDYYVCFKNLRNGEKRYVTFANHASAAIYIMHLIDRVIRKDSCTSIDVIKNIDSLQTIYNKVFSGDGKIKGLKRENKIDSHGNISHTKQRLSQYYSDISRVINDNLYDWDFVLPYRCEADSFILLSPDWISIDKELLPEEWNLL